MRKDFEVISNYQDSPKHWCLAFNHNIDISLLNTENPSVYIYSRFLKVNWRDLILVASHIQKLARVISIKLDRHILIDHLLWPIQSYVLSVAIINYSLNLKF